VANRPTVEEALGLPIDELAFRILAYLAGVGDHHPDFSRRGIGNRNTWVSKHMTLEERERGDAAAKRCLEAYDWLYLHGLVAPNPDATGFTEIGYITELGFKMLGSGERALADFRALERLGVDLHPRLQHRVRRQFLLGEYELAAFAALKEVEVRVREIGGYDDELVGVQLMRTAFSPEETKLGKLADPEQVVAERAGVAHLFHGAIAVFKNPSSHRQVNFEDPIIAAEIVLFADLAPPPGRR
jgi:uncharacterized protein (TIGR02391 family)